MADEDVATPALETPASEPQQVETPETEIEVEGEPLGEDEDELDFGFKKYRVPKELKSAVEDMRADATNKHQAAAAERKALEAREAEFRQQAELSDKELDLRANIKAVEKEIEKYAKFTPQDWAAFRLENAIVTADHERLYDYLRNQKAELDKQLGEATSERTQKAQSDLTKRVEQTLAEAPKIIGSGYKGGETIEKVAKFLADDMGIPVPVIQQNWSPALLKLGHFAQIGLELQKKAAAKPATVAPTPEPLKVVSTKSTVSSGLADNLSMAEWQRRRNAQVRRPA